MLVGLTVPSAAVDPSAVAFASRRAGEDWFCFEQPDRGGAALAAPRRRAAARGVGPERFAAVAAAWRELAGARSPTRPDGPAGAGLVAVGGFAFAPDGGRAPHWAGFGPASWSSPRSRSRAAAATSASPRPRWPRPTTCPRSWRAPRGARRRAAPSRCRCSTRRPPAASGSPAWRRPSTTRRRSPAPSSASARARFEKIVLAREVAVHAPAPHDAAAVFGVLRAAFASCFVFCAGRGDAAFVAASPELLVRREGLRA